MRESLAHQPGVPETLEVKKLLLPRFSILVYRNTNTLNSRAELASMVATISVWLFAFKFELFKIK